MWKQGTEQSLFRARLLVTVLIAGVAAYGLLIRVPDEWRLNWWALQAIHGYKIGVGRPEPTVSGRAFAFIAMTDWRIGKHEKAIETFEKLSTNEASTRWTLWQFQLGTMLRQSGKSVEAAEVWQGSGLEWVMMARCENAVRSRSKESADFWCQALPYLGDNSQALCAYGLYNQWLDALDVSLKGFRDAEKADGTLSAGCLYDYARTLDRLGYYEESLSRYEMAFRAERNPRNLRGAGYALMQLERYDEAQQILLEAYRTSDSNRDRSESARLLGFVYYKLEDYQNAHAYLYEATTSFEGADASAFLYLARTFRELGNNERAVEAYREAITTLGPNRELIWYHYEFARYLLEIGRESEATEVYRGVLEIIPSDQTALDGLRAIEMQGEH